MIFDASLCYGQSINWSHPLNRGLISRWQCVPWYMGGPRAIDLAGVPSKNHGTLTNMLPSTSTSGWGPTTRQGGFGEWLFSANGELISLSDTGSLTLTDAITVLAWIKLRVLGTNRAAYNRSSTSGGGTNAPLLYVNSSDQASFIAAATTAGGSISQGTWTLIGGTYDRVNQITYINGVSVASSAQSAAMASGPNNGIYIGRSAEIDTFRWDGAIDLVAVWNRALASSEIVQFYQASQRRDDPTLNWMARRAYSFSTGVVAAGHPAIRRVGLCQYMSPVGIGQEGVMVT